MSKQKHVKYVAYFYKNYLKKELFYDETTTTKNLLMKLSFARSASHPIDPR